MEQIVGINSEAALIGMERYLNQMLREGVWHDVIRPIRAEISIAQLKEEQGYRPISKEAFDAWVEELALEEEMDELLSMLD